ncbi:hypothetical protein L226DRAFT_535116 [Lentinus tigrinus ALCF2SS1-7]|uniref:N-acetyltransferase domain-containing protein n=1 Tax=Lentinus tigrinus ALCF2SS1-6 TaxID=1328759 RepID=A0A5C2SAA3_9APHY|nr:hypothetical protein L227DRAFT_109245 [Lentinus tigrinus ALCF2SS1-6]RPD74904.1 hypothetical protein L226DRAFT_535116 [Lentinus tigrinus ALCF2SS1-7]
MSVTVREVSNPSDAELDLYAKILAEAFHYSYFGGGLGGNKDLQEPFLRAHLTAALAKGEGEIHVGELPEVGVVGVTLWFGPGHKFLDSDAQREAGWNQIMEKLSPECREWWDIFLSQYDALVERSQGAGVKLGGYHLQVIGTSPEHQKKGVGRALIDYVEKKAHAIKVPTCLETVGETNLAIYKSMNFEVAGSGPIKAPPPYPGDMEMYVFVKHTERDTY